MLTEREIEKFKELFSKYCHGEINSGRCDDGDCEFCVINAAYDRIFYATELDEDEDESEGDEND